MKPDKSNMENSRGKKIPIHPRRQKVFTRQYSIRNERLSSIPQQIVSPCYS